MLIIFTHRRLLLALALLASTSGCDGSGAFTSVAGVVTVDGEPLCEGKVEFWPESGPVATSKIAADGTYNLKTAGHEGVAEGDYRVTITSRKAGDGDVPKFKSLQDELDYGSAVAEGRIVPKRVAGSPMVKWLAPERYSQKKSSGLTAKVGVAGETIDFNLESQ